jgi:uncharacterized sodium:solute symporter family permease YidK
VVVVPQLAVPELTTFVVYFVILVMIGIWVYARTRTLSDFLLGGRGLNTPTAALSAQASDMSGWLLLGFPGAVYAAGLGASWIAIGLAIGTYLNWKFVAPRLRTYTERANDALTLSAYFDDRFEDRTRLLRLLSALVILGFFSVYVSAQLVAGGILFREVFGADVTTASGGVRIGDVTGNVAVRTASGDVRVGEVEGALTARTASGDVATGVIAGATTVRTVSGDIVIGGAGGDEASIQSTSGDVFVAVPPGRGVHLDVATVSGALSSDLATDDGSGGVDLDLRARTVSGDVRLRRGAAASAPPG